MKTYKIPVTWEMYGVCNIEAESLEEAKSRVFNHDVPLPEGDYVMSSIQLDDEEVIQEMNP